MARKGFKWKSLGNNIGSRYQVMQMNRPSDNIVDKHLAIRQPPIVV